MRLTSEETKQFFLSLLKENNGSLSLTRFTSLFSIILSNIVVWYVWIIICILSQTLVNIPDGVVYIYAFANGIAVTGKVAQKFAEKKEENDNTRVD